ncbi:MAG: ABC transporter permease [Oscillospiraceae bacterium]|jgi:peptide/nickel transport system permease protein|nr:ABC transporter permease [Oscillospiraceae bacterium]
MLTTEQTAAANGKTVSKAPSFFRVMRREIWHDKLAFVSLCLLAFIVLYVYIGALGLSSDQVVHVTLGDRYLAPGAEHILGTDEGGRDIYNYLIVGARNSITIAVGITALCIVFGTFIGLMAGYYGGAFDSVVMRVIDFFSMLPTLMLIITVVSIIPRYNVWTFILVMSVLGWMFDARLTRAKTLQQSSLDYVSAAKTLGTPNLKIMFGQVLPNIASIIIVNFTLTLASMMGVEVGLTFLGFGLPANVPSLGTLLAYARVPENLRLRWWLWLPAALFILVMMLCINFVGQAIKRAADAKQRKI